jgi:hypothetical protein
MIALFFERANKHEEDMTIMIPSTSDLPFSNFLGSPFLPSLLPHSPPPFLPSGEKHILLPSSRQHSTPE